MTDFTKYGNWCPDIYRGLYIDRWNDDEVRVAPCCQADCQTEAADSFQFATSPYLTSLREKFQRNERPSECKRCWDYEDHNQGNGYHSRRQKAIITYENATGRKEPWYQVALSSLDYCCTWVCNLACAICRPLNSSLWSAELKQTKEQRRATGRLYELNPAPSLADQLDLTNIYRVHFNGGEPLATKEHIRVLQKLADNGVLKDTVVSYNTNGTLYPTDEVINLWKQSRQVHVSFSIDAIGPAFEYVRYPAKWDHVSNNILRMKKEMPDNVEFGFTVAVGALNVFDMPALWAWYSTNMEPGVEWYRTKFSWQFITEMELGTLPENIRVDAVTLLKEIPMFQGVASYIQSTIDDPTVVESNLHAKYERYWTDQLDTIDQRRGTNWREVLEVGRYYR
jgi:uncharacterized Fe-S cluster-containing radical SAM superfamily protein